MKQIHTEIEIMASPGAVWKILTDFSEYSKWNPFIRSFEGKPADGNTFLVTIQPPESKPMTFKPVCLVMEKNREFRWLGHLFFKGLFDGEHIFQLEETAKGTTRFIHREKFRGLLVPLLWKQLGSNTRKGFEAMNRELKKRAESNVFV